MPVRVEACYPDTHLCHIGSNVWQLKPYALQPQLKVAFNEAVNEVVRLIHGLSITSAVAQKETEKKNPQCLQKKNHSYKVKVKVRTRSQSPLLTEKTKLGL